MSRFWKIALVVLAVVVVAVIGIRVLHKPAGAASRGGADGKDATPPVPVTVVPVVKQNVPVYLTALGTVQALNTVTVIPQVAGRLLSIDFTEGQPVKKGEVLAQIDPRTFQAAYDQAVSRRNQDRSLLATARSNYQRSQDPKYSQYVAKIDMVTQKNTVAQYEAAVAADEAAIRDAKVQLDYTEIRSPIDGVIGNRSARAGAYATVGAQLLSIVPAHGLWIDANFKESQLAQMSVGQPVDITADVLPGRRFRGRIASLAPATGAQFSVILPENATGNFTKIVQRVPVRIVLEDDAAELGTLRPGLSVVARVDQRRSADIREAHR